MENDLHKIADQYSDKKMNSSQLMKSFKKSKRIDAKEADYCKSMVEHIKKELTETQYTSQ